MIVSFTWSKVLWIYLLLHFQSACQLFHFSKTCQFWYVSTSQLNASKQPPQQAMVESGQHWKLKRDKLCTSWQAIGKMCSYSKNQKLALLALCLQLIIIMTIIIMIKTFIIVIHLAFFYSIFPYLQASNKVIY